MGGSVPISHPSVMLCHRNYRGLVDGPSYPRVERVGGNATRMKRTYRALNGLRFLAAIAIVSFHYGPTTNGFSALPAFCRDLVRTGPISLGFFYILSGFVLTHAHSDRVPRTPVSRRSFWFARVARLYPVYLLAFVLFIPIAYEKYISKSGERDERESARFFWARD